MVRRQTVWLSTMMVLSLMLIGYYTMNNGEPGSSQPGDNSIKTTNVTESNAPTGTGGSTVTAMSQGISPATQSVSDVLINDQTQVKDELSKRQSVDLKVIENNNATNDEIQTAQQDMQQVNALMAGISNAESAVDSEGYSNSAVVPTSNGNGATVYVEAKSLTPLKAAEILDSVSQNTGIPAENIHVKALNSKS